MDYLKKREIRQALSKKKIVWTGDLNDDCIARWAGLILRAEAMDEGSWWWSVSDELTDVELEVDSSNNYDEPVTAGQEARNLAEAAARTYVA